MKYIQKIAISLIAFLSLMSGAANAAHTAFLQVGKIQINDAGQAYMRPEGLGPWGGSGCPNATYVYILPTSAGHEHIISLALASKLNGSPIQFYGTCDSTGSYLLITYAHLN